MINFRQSALAMGGALCAALFSVSCTHDDSTAPSATAAAKAPPAKVAADNPDTDKLGAEKLDTATAKKVETPVAKSTATATWIVYTLPG